MAKNALPSQREDFPGWYQEVVKRAGMAEHGMAKGSMVIKPHGYAIWEFVQRAMDDRFKATGHENLYFPLLIPMKVFEKEAEHVEGFSPELAVVTHGGGEELEEPLAIRPTSEAVIWSTYGKWMQSYRDLPFLYNQWCNVLRWEMRTRLFLRTSEFLWQEGHTAHADADEAWDEVLRMLEVYREVAEDVLAIPVIKGRKSEKERFAGAVETTTIEGLMRDGKALQCGTSHFLGQNFSKAYDCQFLNKDGELEYAWGTSWGFSTRMIGATIMAHGDDRGLRLPPAVAPVQVVVVPIYRTDDEQGRVLAVAHKVRDALAGNNVRVRVDDRDQHRPGYKFAEWELKGVPVRVEVGPKDVDADNVMVAPRWAGEKRALQTADAIGGMAAMLEEAQRALYEDAAAFRDANTHEMTSYDEFAEGIEERGGFWRGAWCGDRACEDKVADDTKATLRLLPLEAEDPGAPCAVCGRPGRERATWARAY
ncbi:MAG TPA: proline--tRNA ligase [Actinomycetota bacterium]|jgi:prolyl-tRNA synthetase|nr:proline--tRNA ligase [Actinomycetota bacterium]